METLTAGMRWRGRVLGERRKALLVVEVEGAWLGPTSRLALFSLLELSGLSCSAVRAACWLAWLHAL